MRFVLAMVLAGLVALPLSVSAQAGEGEGGSRLERWHPEAFVDPSQPASEPALKLEVDSTALEVTPTAPPTLEELERQEKKRRGRAIGIGIGVTLGVALVGLAIGSAVAMSNWEL